MLDELYISQFLMTHKLLCSSQELLTLLIERYHLPQSVSDAAASLAVAYEEFRHNIRSEYETRRSPRSAPAASHALMPR